MQLADSVPAVRERAPHALGLAVAAVFCFVLASRATTNLDVLLLFLAAIAGVLALRAPRGTAIAALALGATAFAREPFPVAIAGVQSDAAQIAAYAATGSVMTLAVLGRSAKRWPTITLPVAALCAASLVGFVVGVSDGGDSYTAVGQLKAYLTYVFAVALALAFGGPDGRDVLERWVIRLAVCGSVVVLVLVTLELTPNWETLTVARGASAAVNTLGESAVVRRLHPPVQPLAVLALLLTVVDPRPSLRRRWGSAAVLVPVIGLGFDRSLWAALLLALAVGVRFRTGVQSRVEHRAARAVVGLMVGLAVFALAAQGVLGPTARGASDRLVSIVNPEVATEASAEARVEETVKVYERLRDRPVWGYGLGQPMAPAGVAPGGDIGSESAGKSYFVHNSLLLLWFHLGLLGVAGLVWLSRVVIRDFRRLRVSRSPEMNRQLAALLALLTLAAASLAHAFVLEPSYVLAGCVCLALLSPSADGLSLSERRTGP